MKNKSKKEQLSSDIILNAIDGEEQAMKEVIEFYEKEIHAKFQYIAQRTGMNLSYMPLEEMKQEVRLVLYKAIKKFNT